jgi:hypothetical protein
VINVKSAKLNINQETVQLKIKNNNFQYEYLHNLSLFEKGFFKFLTHLSEVIINFSITFLDFFALYQKEIKTYLAQ